MTSVVEHFGNEQTNGMVGKVNVQTAFGIWLNSKTRLSFKKWMQKQGLTIVNPKVLVLLSLDAVDIVKIKGEQNEQDSKF
ncbi:MAG: hypothetical protein ACUVQY_11355 [Thermoproteota archaeon]